MKYDSREDVTRHIEAVRKNIKEIVIPNLIERAESHDRSKLFEPEKTVFDEWTPKLKEFEYNSPEYKQALKEMGVGLQHHYQNNSHHPEHYPNGIDGMSLLDLIEMICDWKAASEKHGRTTIDGLESSFDRFNIEPQLASIIRNTVEEIDPPPAFNGQRSMKFSTMT